MLFIFLAMSLTLFCKSPNSSLLLLVFVVVFVVDFELELEPPPTKELILADIFDKSKFFKFGILRLKFPWLPMLKKEYKIPNIINVLILKKAKNKSSVT